MMARLRGVLLATVFAALGLSAGVLITQREGEAARESLLEDMEPESPEVRAQRYAALDRDVAELDRATGVLKRVVRLTRPSVVHIEVEKVEGLSERSGRVRLSEEAGSGVIIQLRDKLYVLTNRHVIKGARPSRISISLSDGRMIRPLRTWSDPDTDVAVMEITGSYLTPARLGDSSDLEIGDFVLAMGSPFGLSHSVTYGIISAKGRRDLELGTSEVRFQDFLQTDAAINPGNSGGPLIDLRARVIGINTAIASNSGGNEGIGFAIPINMAMAVARQLIERGRVTRAFLGVSLDSRFDTDAAIQLGLGRLRGARVLGITPNSPAEAAQLQVGDVVLEFNSVRVENDAHLVNLVALTPVGQAIPMTVWRSGKLVELQVQVGDRSKFETTSNSTPSSVPVPR